MIISKIANLMNSRLWTVRISYKNQMINYLDSLFNLGGVFSRDAGGAQLRRIELNREWTGG
jgi:hypothetical protein